MFLIFNIFFKPVFLRSLCFSTSFKSLSLLSCCMKNHYEALGVPRNATQADIKAAYYKLSMIYHPDKNDTIEASKSFRAITEAYEVIGNFKLRKIYDKGILGHSFTKDSVKRSYDNYNSTSTVYKNKPTHFNRMSAYNFDEWSQFHYGEAFSKRYEAKMRYEEKKNPSTVSKNEGKNENIVVVIFALTVIAFIVTYSRDSLDEPNKSK